MTKKMPGNDGNTANVDAVDLDLEELSAADRDLIDTDLIDTDLELGLLDADDVALIDADLDRATRNQAVDPSIVSPLYQRLLIALRQGVLITIALLIMGRLAERLRPFEHLDRGIIDTPFLWAIVIWGIALAFHAIAFDESQMRQIERTPLMGGLSAGALVFVVGLVATESETFTRRLLYVFANSIGAVLFWWGLLSLGYLIVRRLNV